MPTRKTLKKLLALVTLLLVAFGVFEIYRFVRWSDSVRESIHAKFQLNQSLDHGGSQPIKKAQANSESPPHSATETSKTDLESSPNNEAASERQNSADETPFYKKVAKEPLIGTCAKIKELFRPRLIFRLNEARTQHTGITPRVLRKFFALDAGFSSIKLMTRLPHNQNLFAASDKDPSIYKRIEYGAEVLLAQRELEQNLEVARDIENRNYRTFFIGSLLIDNPDLLGNPSLQSVCEELADTDRHISINQMNELIMDLLNEAHVSPEEVHFEPNWESQLFVKSGNEGSYYDGGLLEHFKPFIFGKDAPAQQ
jgi:hypothetical protein